MEGRPSTPRCSICNDKFEVKCMDCFGAPLFCKRCCVIKHRHSPFHRPLLWTATHYTPVSLHSLGFILFVGHDGSPCPQTCPAHIPGISDTLFDLLESFIDSGDNSPNRTYTAPSRNMMLTIVDQNGVFEHEVIFCVCSEDDIKDELLLHGGLFPATFKSIKTVFTFSVLDDFLRDNLECKTTAQQYYSKLQSTTSKMFPNLVPNMYKQLLRASRQWRDLKNRMEQGLGHQEGKDIREGAMSVFCPACPQPGINLPDDWSMRYEPKQLIRTFIMDGNFSTEHMKHRSREKDIALSAGMGFMADPEPYKAHLWTGRQIDQPSTCNTYKAIEQANSSRAHLDVTGIGATACNHGFFVPTFVVDFQKGERQVTSILHINMDYSICKALSYNMQDIPIALVMYDIMCQYRVNFQDRVKDSPHLSLPSSLELWTGIGLFHIHGHQDSCLPRYSLSYIPGAKQVDGEIIESLWAPLNNISRSIRGMSLSHRQEVLDAHMNHSNWKKLVHIVPSLLKRWKRLGDGLEASSKAYKALSEHFPSKTAQWLHEDKQAQEDRQTMPSSMDIYDTVKQKAPSQADIQTQLIMEEEGDHSICGQTSWILCGLKIQELQYVSLARMSL
ncbi:hypothetical protein EI94DRAFT_1614829 [Lactarius quietus]|nr:hypothetical protein EI94DRAFT_1614829 [Lactarius quietus]